MTDDPTDPDIDANADVDADTEQADGPGKPDDPGQPDDPGRPDDFDPGEASPAEFVDLPVDALEDALEDIGNFERLKEIRDAEEKGPQRVTGMAAIERRMEKAKTDSSLEAREAADEVEGMQRIVVRSLDGYSTRNYDFPAGQARRVPATAEVKKALRRGQLQFISGR